MIVWKVKRIIVLPVYLFVQLSAIESAVTVAEPSRPLALYNRFYTVLYNLLQSHRRT